MAIPKYVQTTSTDKPLKSGPKDMPDRGGRDKPNLQTTSSQVTMSRKENFVAAFGNRPGMGTEQCTSTKVTLHRNANSPYQNKGINATRPQLGFKGKKKA
jgi:hypothetical protein